MLFLSNVFNDPSSPWYYVVGVIFLALIFGALALYIIMSGKKSNGEKEPEQNVDKDEVTEHEAQPEEQTEQQHEKAPENE